MYNGKIFRFTKRINWYNKLTLEYQKDERVIIESITPVVVRLKNIDYCGNNRNLETGCIAREDFKYLEEIKQSDL